MSGSTSQAAPLKFVMGPAAGSEANGGDQSKSSAPAKKISVPSSKDPNFNRFASASDVGNRTGKRPSFIESGGKKLTGRISTQNAIARMKSGSFGKNSVLKVSDATKNADQRLITAENQLVITTDDVMGVQGKQVPVGRLHLTPEAQATLAGQEGQTHYVAITSAKGE